MMLGDFRVRLLEHSVCLYIYFVVFVASQAYTAEAGLDGLNFMQEMLELAKRRNDESGVRSC